MEADPHALDVDPPGGGPLPAVPAVVRVPGSSRRRWLRICLTVSFLVIAFVVLRDKLPSWSSIAAALRAANWWLVAAALFLQVGSVWLQIWQQRVLLGAFGVSVSMPRIGAITYSSTAISMSMPVGGAVSAGYTYRQYRSSGAAPAIAATVLLLSGVASLGSLMALTAAGIGVTWLRRVIRLPHQPWQFVALAVGLGGIVELLVLLLGRLGRRTPKPTDGTHRWTDFQDRHPKVGAVVGPLTLAARQASQVARGDWRLALFLSAGNWALDAASLYASCLAFGIHLSVLTLGAVYIGVQLVRQIPITPGGVGVVEASLLAGLVAAHAAKGPAAAAVLVYRLLAAWLIVPIGLVMLAVLRRIGPTVVGSEPD